MLIATWLCCEMLSFPKLKAGVRLVRMWSSKRTALLTTPGTKMSALGWMKTLMVAGWGGCQLIFLGHRGPPISLQWTFFCGASSSPLCTTPGSTPIFRSTWRSSRQESSESSMISRPIRRWFTELLRPTNIASLGALRWKEKVLSQVMRMKKLCNGLHTNSSGFCCFFKCYFEPLIYIFV